jgi:hypothetical protein
MSLARASAPAFVRAKAFAEAENGVGDGDTFAPVNPLFFIHPELALAIPLPLWRSLFAAFQFVPSPPLPRSLTPLAHARALWGIRLPPPFVALLSDLSTLATASGREALLEAAADIDFPTPNWDAIAPAELAATLLLRHTLRKKPADDLTPLFERAFTRLARRFVDRIPYEILATSAQRVPSTAKLPAALRAVVSGPWSDVWSAEDDDGNLHIAVLYAAPAAADHDVSATGPTLATRRALRADVLRLDVADGRLRIETARPPLVWSYAAAIGTALYGDAHFFSSRPSFTLKPLQLLGAAGFRDAKVPALSHMVVGLQWDTGDDARFEGRSTDALASFEAHTRITGGYIVRATIRFDFRGAPRPVDVYLELPYRLSFSDPRFEPQCRAALAALGIFQPGSVPDDATTLWPCEHAEWRFREAVGHAAFEVGLAAGLFTRVKGGRVASAEYRHLGRGYRAFDLPSEPKKRYALGDDPSVRAVTVAEPAMMVLRFNRDAFVKKGCDELGLDGAPRPKELPPEVLVLGTLTVPSARLFFVYVMAPPTTVATRASLKAAIERAAGLALVVTFVPTGRGFGAGRVELELEVAEQLGCATWKGKTRAALEQLGLASEVEATRIAASDARVVVRVPTGYLAIDGLVLEGVADSVVLFVAELVRAKGAIIKSATMEHALSPARMAPGAATAAKKKLDAAMEKACARAKRPMPSDWDDLVQWVKNKGWRLGVPGEEG